VLRPSVRASHRRKENCATVSRRRHRAMTHHESYEPGQHRSKHPVKRQRDRRRTDDEQRDEDANVIQLRHRDDGVPHRGARRAREACRGREAHSGDDGDDGWLGVDFEREDKTRVAYKSFRPVTIVSERRDGATHRNTTRSRVRGTWRRQRRERRYPCQSARAPRRGERTSSPRRDGRRAWRNAPQRARGHR